MQQAHFQGFLNGLARPSRFFYKVGDPDLLDKPIPAHSFVERPLIKYT